MCSLHKESRSNSLPFKTILKQLISYWYSTYIFILSLGTCVFSFWFSEDYNLRSGGLHSVKKRFTYPFLSAAALFLWRLSSSSNGLGCYRVDVSEVPKFYSGESALSLLKLVQTESPQSPLGLPSLATGHMSKCVLSSDICSQLLTQTATWTTWF